MPLHSLRVNHFPGGFNWPSFVAIEKGLFARQGLAVELQATTGSVAQMTDFADGRFEIAMTAFDNIVAYAEGQGEAPIGTQPEFFAFMGSDDSFLSLAARPEIANVADLRGRALSVDAATTGYAFVLFDMLAREKVTPGDYRVVKVGGMKQRFDDLCKGGNDATLLSAPYDILAQQNGMRILQRAVEPYQGNVAAARRSWAAENGDAVSAYIRAHLAAVVWLYDAANQSEACDILQNHVAGMNAALATASYGRLLEPEHGFFRDGRMNDAGVRRVLALRSRYAPAQRALTEASKYVDMRYWQRAVA